uniref:Uncharacterized protein n=1 Tax=Arundo donax TaxID=35708 RepID=A0A0A9B9F7_ARUDO
MKEGAAAMREEGGSGGERDRERERERPHGSWAESGGRDGG